VPVAVSVEASLGVDVSVPVPASPGVVPSSSSPLQATTATIAAHPANIVSAKNLMPDLPLFSPARNVSPAFERSSGLLAALLVKKWFNHFAPSREAVVALAFWNMLTRSGDDACGLGAGNDHAIGFKAARKKPDRTASSHPNATPNALLSAQAKSLKTHMVGQLLTGSGCSGNLQRKLAGRSRSLSQE
jgi:hypothetical protein